jgi:hypothetical protein
MSAAESAMRPRNLSGALVLHRLAGDKRGEIRHRRSKLRDGVLELVETVIDLRRLRDVLNDGRL